MFLIKSRKPEDKENSPTVNANVQVVLRVDGTPAKIVTDYFGEEEEDGQPRQEET